MSSGSSSASSAVPITRRDLSAGPVCHCARDRGMGRDDTSQTTGLRPIGTLLNRSFGAVPFLSKHAPKCLSAKMRVKSLTPHCLRSCRSPLSPHRRQTCRGDQSSRARLHPERSSIRPWHFNRHISSSTPLSLWPGFHRIRGLCSPREHLFIALARSIISDGWFASSLYRLGRCLVAVRRFRLSSGARCCKHHAIIGFSAGERNRPSTTSRNFQAQTMQVRAAADRPTAAACGHHSAPLGL